MHHGLLFRVRIRTLMAKGPSGECILFSIHGHPPSINPCVNSPLTSSASMLQPLYYQTDPVRTR